MNYLKYLRHFDYLSTEAKLTFNSRGDTRLQSIIGGILSLLSILASVALSIYFFIQFVGKNNKTLISSSEYSPNVNISYFNTLPIMLRLSSKENKPISDPERVYKVALQFWYGGENNSDIQEKGYVNIDVEKCNINKHFGEYQSLFKDLSDLDTFFCPVLRKYNQTVYGLYGNVQPFGYYHFVISKCINYTDNDNCVNDTLQQSLLTSIYLDMRVIDYSIYSQNIKSVKVPTLRSDRHMLSVTVFKRIWFYLNWVRYTTDDGIFFQSKRTESFHQVNSFRYDTDLRNISTTTVPGTFASLSILNTGQTIVYHRHYHKIQDYLATVGGIINFISTIAYCLNFCVSKNSYYLNLINGFVIADYYSILHNSKKHIMLNNSAIGVKANIEKVNNFHHNNNIKKEEMKFNRRFQKLTMKWYIKFLPFCWSIRNNKNILRHFEIINRLLSVFEIMKAVEVNKIMKYKFEDKMRKKNLTKKTFNSLFTSQVNFNPQRDSNQVITIYKQSNNNILYDSTKNINLHYNNSESNLDIINSEN